MIDHPLARNAGEGEDEGGCIHEDDGGEKGSAHPRDLARLPIRLKLQTISLAEGVRAALSVAVIFAAMEILGLPVLREAGLAALLTCICDPGGPIRRRVPVLLCFTAFGAVITVCGGLARAAGIGVALPFGVLAIFCASLARLYGEAPQRLGALLASVTILSLDYPLRDAQQAEALAGSFIGGGLWATLLTMVIWPVYPYRPVRRAVAQVYRTLASLAADLGDLARDPGSAAVWELHARTHRRAVRESVEAARTEIMMALRARGATSHRAVQSLIRLEAGDQIFGGLLGWSGLLEHETVERRASYRALRRLRPLLIRLANTIAADNAAEDTAVPAAIDRILAEAAMLPEHGALRAIIDAIVERLRIAHTLAVPENFLPGDGPTGRRLPLVRRLTGPLRANLDWRSPALRHAVRTAAVTAPALAFTQLWFTPYDHWLTISIVATMQPLLAPTYINALERIIGSVIGGVAAALVGLVCTTPAAITMAFFPLSVFALAVRSVSLSFFMIGLTPLIVLLVETGQPDTSEWVVAAVRALLTIAGGLIAVGASFVFWPSKEPERLPDEMRAAIAAHGAYAEAALSEVLNEPAGDTANRARRAAGLTSNSLEASINRTLIEFGTAGQAILESALVIDAGLRRFAGRVAAMPFERDLTATVPAYSLRAWRAWIADSMRKLAAGNLQVSPRPELPASDSLLRVARQIELMAGALERHQEASADPQSIATGGPLGGKATLGKLPSSSRLRLAGDRT